MRKRERERERDCIPNGLMARQLMKGCEEVKRYCCMFCTCEHDGDPCMLLKYPGRQLLGIVGSEHSYPEDRMK